jgi:hypothetical protein
MMIRVGRALALVTCVFSLGACAQVQLQPRELPGQSRNGGGDNGGSEAGNGAQAAAAPVRETAAAHPRDVFANGSRAEAVREQALAQRGTRIVVSTEGRSLWLMRDGEIVFSAPVAVGMHEKLEYDGRTWDFETPIGQRRVLAKSPNPTWVPPDWHYFEKVVERGLEPVQLRAGQRVQLSDGTRIEVRGNNVGRVNSYDNFWAFTPGTEIIFDGKIFIPPFGTRQRQIPDVLGTHKLELGDGYLIHGTNDDGSIGGAVSHGCVRMYNDDVAHLYSIVPVGTRVYVF